MTQMLTLKEIRSHAQYPFSDFRENDASFLMLELFWTAFISETVGADLTAEMEILQDFERDLDRNYDPLMIDFWIPKMRRGVRVLLLENFDNLPLCETVTGDARFNCFHGFGYHSSKRGITSVDDTIDQAVFRTDMSDASLALTQRGVHSFLVDQVGFDVLDAGFKEYYQASNGPTEAEWDAYYERLNDADDGG